MQISVPTSSADNRLAEYTRGFYGTGDVKSVVINKHHIGDYVARIIADDRTLNQYVLVNEDEATLNEIWDIAEKAYGKSLDRESSRVVRTAILHDPSAEDSLIAVRG
jgi:NmrA-like family